MLEQTFYYFFIFNKDSYLINMIMKILKLKMLKNLTESLIKVKRKRK